MNVTEAQIQMIDDLILHKVEPEDADMRTFKALCSKGLYDVDALIVTQLGLEHTTLPTIEQATMTITRPLTYRGYTFQPNTTFMIVFITFPKYKGRERPLIEATIRHDGGVVYIKVYKPIGCVLSTMLMPDTAKLPLDTK